MSETLTTIQIRRGLKADLPAVAEAGEILLTTDTHELFFGTGIGVVQLVAESGDAPITTTVEISSAQLLAMGVTPVVLLEAPAGDSFNSIESITLVYHFGTTPYDAAVNFEVQFGTTNPPIWALSMAGFLDQTQSMVVTPPQFNATCAQTPFHLADVLGAAVEAITTGDITGGDGTLEVVIVYRVVAVS